MDSRPGEHGCLLLHGLTATSAEMSSLKERLVAAGYEARAPMLPGHGSRAEDLAARTWEDWYATALRAWNELSPCRFRAVVGVSMGALLALHLAQDRASEVGAVAALSPAIELHNQRRANLALWFSRLPWLPRSIAFVPKDPAGTPPGRQAYDVYPIAALASMLRLQRLVRTEVPEIRAPLLIAEGGLDRTIAPGAGAWLERRAGSSRTLRRVFAASDHLLTEDVDRDEVADLVTRFFAEAAAGTDRRAQA